MIRPIRGSADTKNGCAAHDSVDDSVGRRTSSLKISSDESLNDHGSRGNIDELGMNPVLLEGSNLLRHPKSGGHGPDAEYPKVIRLSSAAPALTLQSNAANNTHAASLALMSGFKSAGSMIERQTFLRIRGGSSLKIIRVGVQE